MVVCPWGLILSNFLLAKKHFFWMHALADAPHALERDTICWCFERDTICQCFERDTICRCFERDTICQRDTICGCFERDTICGCFEWDTISPIFVLTWKKDQPGCFSETALQIMSASCGIFDLFRMPPLQLTSTWPNTLGSPNLSGSFTFMYFLSINAPISSMKAFWKFFLTRSLWVPTIMTGEFGARAFKINSSEIHVRKYERTNEH